MQLIYGTLPVAKRPHLPRWRSVHGFPIFRANEVNDCESAGLAHTIRVFFRNACESASLHARNRYIWRYVLLKDVYPHVFTASGLIRVEKPAHSQKLTHWTLLAWDRSPESIS